LEGEIEMKIIMDLLKKFFNVFEMTMVLADEPAKPADPPAEPAKPANPPAEPAKPSQLNLEDILARVRAEEKDKLYPKITKLEGEKDTLTKKINDYIIEVASKDDKIKELEKKVADLINSKGDLEELKNLKVENEKLKKQIEDEKAEVAKQKLEAYKKQKIDEAKGAIIPELVTGNDEKEIDASVEKAKQRFAEIMKGAGIAVAPTNPNLPPATPSGSQTPLDFKGMTAGQVRNMGMKDYAEYRKKLGLK
jgi:hypothetical protein